MIKPLDFQQKAIDDLVRQFKKLWRTEQDQIQITLKSPTGSGKTFMTSSFVNEMTDQPDWDSDIAWIWITFSDDLAMQSKEKFEAYFKQSMKNQLLTVADFNQGKLNRNDVLFLNWQKLVATNAKDRVLRRPEDIQLSKESGSYWEDVIEATHADGRKIIMIIDESHKNVTESAQKIVIDVANPKIILNVSATPKKEPTVSEIKNHLAGWVEVERKDVIAEGLIKEKIQCQVKEDIEKLSGTDLDETLITIAMEKRRQLSHLFELLGKTVNPLVLIQLPNDDKTLLDAGEKSKEQIVLDFLKEKGIEEHKIALWFDGKKKNMEFISDNDCPVEYMLFKEAAGTGWDCPRAHILVMFREINSPTFKTQTIGRILRMPEPELKDDYKNAPALRTGYLFTNYDRNQVTPPENWGDKNKPAVFTAKPKEGYAEYDFEGLLVSDYLSRTDYGDFVSAGKFQKQLLTSFDDYFGFCENDSEEQLRKKLEAKDIELSPELNYSMLADEEFADYDNIYTQIKLSKNSAIHKMSRNDIEKTYNHYCIKILLSQVEDETKIGNAARSWSTLKTSVRAWFRKHFGEAGTEIFVADMMRGDNSRFAGAIYKALKDFAPVREELLKDRRERNLSNYIFRILPEYSYTDDFEAVDFKKCLIQPCYVKKEYKGRANETAFMHHLEMEKNVDWWYKNGDHGQNNFGFMYVDSETGKDCMFYPDWIVRYTDGTIGIYDTKGGTSAVDAKDRAESLYKKLQALNHKLKKEGSEVIKGFEGGIVVKPNQDGIWFINDSEEYNYDGANLGKGWRPFTRVNHNARFKDLSDENSSLLKVAQTE